LDKSTCESFKLTTEEAREIKKLKRNGFKDFAEAYYEYLQLGKREGSLDYTLQEFCETKGVQYRLPK
jgi:type II secretory pathway component PulF